MASSCVPATLSSRTVESVLLSPPLAACCASPARSARRRGGYPSKMGLMMEESWKRTTASMRWSAHGLGRATSSSSLHAEGAQPR
eukprot:2917033-Rhodomonas_salina.2